MMGGASEQEMAEMRRESAWFRFGCSFKDTDVGNCRDDAANGRWNGWRYGLDVAEHDGWDGAW